MKAAHFKGGYVFRFQGAPSGEVVDFKPPQKIRLSLKQSGLTFEPVCEAGAKVAALEALAKAKETEEIKLVTPLAGEVTAIEAEADPPYVEVAVEGEGAPKGEAPGDTEMELRTAMAGSGLWLRIVDGMTGFAPALDSKPELVIVRAVATEPFIADEQLAVKGLANEVAAGVKVLEKMSGGAKVAVVVPEGKKGDTLSSVKPSGDFWEVEERYPAENPGLLDGLIGGWKGRKPGRTWVVGLQDLLAFQELAGTGKYDPRWVVALSGQAFKEPSHARIWPGTMVRDVVDGRLGQTEDVRKIVGGLINGAAASDDGWIEPPARAVTAVPEHTHREFVGFMMPGVDKDSFSYGFLSKLLPGLQKPVHAGLRGQLRYCISCSYCEWICPADLNPQILWKLVDVKELEEATSLGLLRCVGCGLCSYCCPCKIELSADLTAGQTEFREVMEEEARLRAKAQEG